MRCRVCGNETLAPFLDFGPMPLANRLLSVDQLGATELKYPLILLCCQSCTFVQLSTVVPPQDLYADYPYATGTSPALVKHFHEMARDVVRTLHLKDGDLVVDVGSNDGTLLSGFKGMRRIGVEPAETVGSIAQRKGIPTIPRFFTPELANEIRRLHGDAAAITATNVFTHVDRVYDFIEAVKVLLRPGGALVIEVYYLLSLLENVAFDQVYHEHLSYFTVRTLLRCFQNTGLEVFHVEKVPVHGGSLRAYVGWANQHTVRSSVKAMLGNEPGRQELFERYEAFARRVDEAKWALQNFAWKAKAEGKVVAGYGAAAKATVMLNHAQLGPDDVSYIVDNNPLKQGKFVPGVRVPIVGSRHLEEKRPDYVLIFAWNLAEEILESLTDLKKEGVRFLVPVPVVREVG